jgi:cytochrome c-type biogenesis protein CcmH/NrfF
MALLWTVPVLAVVIGAVVVVVQLRLAADAATELGDALRRVDEVRTAVDQVRREGLTCAETSNRVRNRAPGPRAA